MDDYVNSVFDLVNIVLSDACNVYMSENVNR